MGLLDKFKTQTELDNIKTAFNFLVTAFGFKLVGKEEPKNFKAKYLVIYRNDQSKLQVELCGDDSWFHCEIRRIIDGQPAKYSDNENCFGFEDLAVLESNNNYEHMDYYAGGSNGLTMVLTNTANLFKRNKIFFTTDGWIDLNRVEKLKNEDFQTKFGFNLSDNKNKPTYFGELKKQAMKLLTQNGYKLILDSEELSPFDSRGMVQNFAMQKGEKKIEITQQDWRDSYFLYNIKIGGKNIFEMNIREHQDIDVAVKLTMEKLRQCI
jgi:hypothetical protein